MTAIFPLSPAENVNESLEKWKEGATVVLRYRAQQPAVELDIYKVVAEQKVIDFVCVCSIKQSTHKEK